MGCHGVCNNESCRNSNSLEKMEHFCYKRLLRSIKPENVCSNVSPTDNSASED